MGIQTSRFHAYRAHVLAAEDFDSLKRKLGDMLRHAGQSEDRLLALFPQLNQGFVDNPLQQLSDTNVTPVPVQIQVTQKSSLPGLSFIKVILPQQQLPATQQLFNLAIGRGPNSPLAPLSHRFQSASSNSFDSAANVQTYDPTEQTFLTLPDTNLHWRVQSAFDTVNFNDFGPSIPALVLP